MAAFLDVPPIRGVFLGPAVEQVAVDVETRILDALPLGTTAALPTTG
jgi:hypothetical protein